MIEDEEATAEDFRLALGLLELRKSSVNDEAQLTSLLRNLQSLSTISSRPIGWTSGKSSRHADMSKKAAADPFKSEVEDVDDSDNNNAAPLLSTDCHQKSPETHPSLSCPHRRADEDEDEDEVTHATHHKKNLETMSRASPSHITKPAAKDLF
ncbi:hypothetical protein KEM56_004270, partial [Ascosphaera pollenicola]